MNALPWTTTNNEGDDMTGNDTLQDILTPLANQLATIQEQIAELQADEAEIKAKIRSTVPGVDTYAAGGLSVRVSENKRFDQRLAAKVIPAHIVPLVSTTETVKVFDKDRIKVLAPDQFDACFTVYETKISLK